MSNGDAHEVYVTPFLFEFIHKWLVLLRFLFQLCLEAEVGAKAYFNE
jgi:hypothetical protein